MSPSDANQLKTLIDYVTQIRGQDLGLFQTLLTIFMGTVFGAILVAVLTNKENETTTSRRWFVRISGTIALLLFLGFFAGLRIKHTIRKEFCLKWMGGICQNLATHKSIPELIEDFSRQRYGLYYVNPKDPNFALRDENRPEGWLDETVWQHSQIVDSLPYVSVFVVFMLVFTRPSSNVKKENKISISSSSSIETEGKLKIN